MPAAVITSKNYKKEIKRCKLPVLLSFRAEKGVSSFLLSKTIEELSEELNGKIKVGVVNSEPDNSELIKAYNINVFPITVLIKNGVVTERIVGILDKKSFLKVLSQFFINTQ